MAGTGYNIPISVSYARTETINPILEAGTVFNFSSPWGSGGTNDITSRLTGSATATSSAAEGGNAGSQTQSNTAPQNSGDSSLNQGPSKVWLYVAAGLGVSTLALLWLKFRR